MEIMLLMTVESEGRPNFRVLYITMYIDRNDNGIDKPHTKKTCHRRKSSGAGILTSLYVEILLQTITRNNSNRK